jgi:hypothetical protein
VAISRIRFGFIGKSYFMQIRKKMGRWGDGEMGKLEDGELERSN